MNTAVIPGKDMETRLALLDNKLDIVLEELNAQKRDRQQVEDLMSDLSIIGKDMFETTVNRLDKAGIEFDGYDLEKFVLKVIRNISTFNTLIEFLESSNDFIKDISPVIRQAGLDLISKLHSLEQKGYFVFFNEFLNIVDQIVTHFTKEDLRALADNVVTILETMKNLTQPDILKSVDNAVSVFKNLDTDNIEKVSMWKALRVMNSKDGKRALGFIMTFLLNLVNSSKQNNKI